jgi:predicted nucleotidyltransferase
MEFQNFSIDEIATTHDNYDILVAHEVSNRIKLLLGQRLEKVILFGSRARGDSNIESDYDFLIIADFDEPRWPKRAVEISRFVEAAATYKIATDYVPVTKWEYEHKFLLRKVVQEEGIVLYDRGYSELAEESKG